VQEIEDLFADFDSEKLDLIKEKRAALGKAVRGLAKIKKEIDAKKEELKQQKMRLENLNKDCTENYANLRRLCYSSFQRAEDIYEAA
jgi:hypothetical protein